MITIAHIFKQHGAQYLKSYQHKMPPSHQKTMRDIMICRSGLLGWHKYYCTHCRQTHFLNNSCRNRHCPQCQTDKTQNWINRQQEQLLPVEYFLFTFTIPEALRRLARSNQKIFYNILFRVSRESLQLLAGDKRFIGGETGMVGVLHTWSQTLEYHPHIHYIIPGMAFDTNKQTLRFARDGFLVHVKALSRLFRSRFKRALQNEHIYEKISNNVFDKEWIVHGKSVGSGGNAVKYLAQYVYRVAISNQRIISCQNGQVTFTYKDRNTECNKLMKLDAQEFIRRFLQHVLPKGFQKVRYYGFLHPKKRMFFNQIRLVLKAKCIIPENKTLKWTKEILCPDCRKPMIFINSKNTTRPPPLNQILNQLMCA